MNDNMEKNQDFKYIIQDTSHVYFGKELTYEELMEHNDIPFKFKAIISAYVSKDVTLQKKMIQHLLDMDEKSFTYQIYKQLKMEVRVFYKEEKKTLGGKKKEHWVHKTCPFVNFMEQYRDDVREEKITVEDIAVSKLALMLISI